MSRAERAAADLPKVKRLTEQHGPALQKAFGLLMGGALVGPAADELFEGLAARHRGARSGFFEAFDAVRRLAAEAEGGPPRIGEPYVPGPPAGGPKAGTDVRSGSPEALNLLGQELTSAGRSLQDAGGPSHRSCTAWA